MTESEARQLAGPDADRRGEGQAGRATARQSDSRSVDVLVAVRRARAGTLRTRFADSSGCLCIAQRQQHCRLRIPAAGHGLSRTRLSSSRSTRTPPSAALQSRVHEVWARFFGSSMKDDLRYTPSDCFETFPFPTGFETDPRLEAAGKAYYEFRAALMVANNEGLTKTYNRFHDPDERSTDILRAARAARRHGPRRPRRLRLDRPPPDLRVPARLRGRRGRGRRPAAGARSPGATAGPTSSATRSSPACSRSTRSAPSRSGLERGRATAKALTEMHTDRALSSIAATCSTRTSTTSCLSTSGPTSGAATAMGAPLGRTCVVSPRSLIKRCPSAPISSAPPFTRRRRCRRVQMETRL